MDEDHHQIKFLYTGFYERYHKNDHDHRQNSSLLVKKSVCIKKRIPQFVIIQ